MEPQAQRTSLRWAVSTGNRSSSRKSKAGGPLGRGRGSSPPAPSPAFCGWRASRLPTHKLHSAPRKRRRGTGPHRLWGGLGNRPRWPAHARSAVGWTQITIMLVLHPSSLLSFCPLQAVCPHLRAIVGDAGSPPLPHRTDPPLGPVTAPHCGCSAGCILPRSGSCPVCCYSPGASHEGAGPLQE